MTQPARQIQARPAAGGGSGFLPPEVRAEDARRIQSRILSPEQLESLIRGCRGQFADRNRTMIQTCYGLACRSSEVCGLLWRNIDWDERITFWRPKRRSTWTVGPPERTWSALRAWRMRCGPQDRDAPVFLSRGGKQLRPEQFSRIVTRAAVVAGLPETKYGAHSLRHSRCAHLLAAGVDIAFIQQIAGHKSPSITAIYVAAEALAQAERVSASVDF